MGEKLLIKGAGRSVFASEQDGRAWFRTEQDPNPILDNVAELRKARTPKHGQDLRHVARLPMTLVEQWCNEAGIDFNDWDAVTDIVQAKLLSGEVSKLRVDERSF